MEASSIYRHFSLNLRLKLVSRLTMDNRAVCGHEYLLWKGC
jgi:hypothetical protein